MRKNHQRHQIRSIVDSCDKDRGELILQEVKLRQGSAKNFVILFESLTALSAFRDKQLPLLQSTMPQHKVYILDCFNNNHSQNVSQLLNLQNASRFIVLSLRVAGRGIDFRGTEVAYVILGYNPSSVSEAVQAISRGSRDL